MQIAMGMEVLWANPMTAYLSHQIRLIVCGPNASSSAWVGISPSPAYGASQGPSNLDKTKIRGTERTETGKDRSKLSRTNTKPTGKGGRILHRAGGGNPTSIHIEIIGTTKSKRGIGTVKFGSPHRTAHNDVVAAPTMVAAVV